MRAFLQHVQSAGIGPGFGFELEVPNPSEASRPFAFTRADFDARKRDPYACLPVPPDDEDGIINIADHGSGIEDAIVVTGELRGSIWCCDTGGRAYDTNRAPSTFLDWYEAWLSVDRASG